MRFSRFRLDTSWNRSFRMRPKLRLDNNEEYPWYKPSSLCKGIRTGPFIPHETFPHSQAVAVVASDDNPQGPSRPILLSPIAFRPLASRIHVGNPPNIREQLHGLDTNHSNTGWSRRVKRHRLSDSPPQLHQRPLPRQRRAGEEASATALGTLDDTAGRSVDLSMTPRPIACA